MSSADLDALLARMPQIAEAVERFSSESVQAEVLQALPGAFGAGNTKDVVRPVEHDSSDDALDSQNNGVGQRDGKTSSSKRSSSGRSKQSFNIDKSLDLLNGGAPSFKEFSNAKAPNSQVEKCLVSVYWLTRVHEDGELATIGQVYTCYKHMDWPVPSDLANTLSKAGTEGWLDSKDREKLRVVVAGENHLEHEMSANKKAPNT